jgi:hypothetical protein
VTETVPTPVSGEVTLDGTPSLERPSELPTVFQLHDPDGHVTQTAYLLPGDALPVYDGVLPEPPPLASIGWIKSRRQLALLGTGLGLGVASGATYGMAAWSAAVYEQDQPGWNEGQLGQREQLTNGLVLGSAGLGLAAIGLATTSFLVVEW